MESKPYPRRPMHCRDKTSNAPSRRDVQPTIEISSRSEKAEVEYIWSVQPLRRVGQVQQRNRKISVGSDNPTPQQSDYPNAMEEGSDKGLGSFSRETVSHSEKLSMGSDDPTQ